VPRQARCYGRSSATLEQGVSGGQQALLNIVKLRYADTPVFVDVASIVAGYSMQTGVSVNGTLSSDRAIQGNYASIGGQAIYTDRPTITYVPMTGEKFLRGLITPIDPKNIFFMLQSGYAADFILGLAVESLNGVRNRSAAGGTVREADPEFIRALLRDNPFLRCSSVAGKLALRVDGFRDDSRRPENAGRDKGNAGHGAQPAVDAAGREIPATPAPRSPTRRGDVGCLNGRSAGHGTAGVSLVSP
jgi:hypothetical protein